MATNKTNTRKTNTAAASVNNLVDHAFVPDMQEKEPLTAEQKKAAFFARKADVVVTSPVYAMPVNGEHKVVIHSWDYVEPEDGNAYLHFEIKEPSSNIVWKANISAEKNPARPWDPDFETFLNEVNTYNRGMLYQKSILECIIFLESHEFTIWTQQYINKKGERKCQIFSNPNQYNYWAYREARKREDKAAREKAYRDAKAASENDKPPFEV